MSKSPLDNEMSGLRRLQDWWLELPLSYRVNALLYFLGGLALIFLVSTLFRGDDKPRQIQVGAGVPPTTATTVKGQPPISLGPLPLVSTTVPPVTGPTTTLPTAGPAIPGGGSSGLASQTPTGNIDGTGAGTPDAGGGDEPSGGGGDGGDGGGGTDSPPPTDPAPPPAPPCRNSSEPSCGAFSWDPSPGNNEPLRVNVVLKTPNPRAGDEVRFEVTASDADHSIDPQCFEARFGDSTFENGNCPPPPECPPHYGPWTPPSRQAGSVPPTEYRHRYGAAGPYTVTFTFRSRSSTRCSELDPYASVGVGILSLQVIPRPGT
jgi:hypothetical protein